MSKKCIACGIKLEDDAMFCKECGKKQIAEKEQDAKMKKQKKEIIGYSLAIMVIGIVFLRILFTSDVSGAIFLTTFLIFIVMAIYFVVLEEKHKRSKGIPIDSSMTAEDITNILRENLECSFVKEISINGKGNIEFSCKFGHHTAKIENNELHVDRLARKFGDYMDIEEAWYLQKHIEGVLDPGNAKEDMGVLDNKFLKYIKRFRIMRILKYIIIVLMVVVIIQELGLPEYMKSGGVSSAYFTKYSTNISIGEALSRVCVNEKWDKLESGGREYVSYTGENASGEELYILFEKDGDSCQIVTIEIDGEDYSLFQEMVLEAIYSNALD